MNRSRPHPRASSLPAARATTRSRPAPEPAQLQRMLSQAVDAHQSGDLANAAGIYRTLLQHLPDNPQVLYLSGVLAMQQGRFDDADQRLTRALIHLPDNAEVWFNLGVLRKQQQRLDEAEQAYRRVLDLEPDHLGALNNLGNMLVARAAPAEAVTLFEQMAALAPESSLAHFNLALALRSTGDTHGAINHMQRTIALQPDSAPAHTHLGAMLASLDRHPEAEQHYHHALRLAPDDTDTRLKLAGVLAAQDKLEDAAGALDTVLRQTPGHPEAIHLLAAMREKQGRLADAIALLASLHSAAPGDTDLLKKLAGLHDLARQPDQAIACYQRLLALQPGDAEARTNLAQLLQRSNRTAEADDHFKRAFHDLPAPEIAFQHAMLLPVMPESAEQIIAWRHRLHQRIRELIDQQPRIDNPRSLYPRFRFYLAYHGCDDRPVVSDIARFTRQACPPLTFVAPHCREPHANHANRRLRIAFLSRHLKSHHTIGKLNRGFIEQLGRQRFHVTIADIEAEGLASPDIISLADDHITLPRALEKAQSILAHQQFDVIFYPDIGMDAHTYLLAFARLAPVQVTTWGHPVTTGIDTLDAFLSARDLEPDSADDHYTEQLVQLATCPTCYHRPHLPETTDSTRAALGLPEDKRIYLCPQSLFKMHPDSDRIFEQIAQRDDKALIVMIDGLLRQPLQQRWQDRAPQLLDRALFLPPMPVQQFLLLIQACDVMLDPPHFGGGNTTYEAFAAGTPIITWPGHFMRSRVTRACYAAMGINDCIAESLEHYPALATELATDSDRLHDLRHRIRSASDVLYDNPSVIREIEDWLENAVTDALATGFDHAGRRLKPRD